MTSLVVGALVGNEILTSSVRTSTHGIYQGIIDILGSNADSKFKNLIEDVSKKSLRIVNLSMGSKNRNDWECFFNSIKKYKNLIFVVSAGNDKQNIDINPIYPASFKLKNIIVVSSSTKNGQLGRDSNFGAENVDLISSCPLIVEMMLFHPLNFCLRQLIHLRLLHHI